MTREPLTHPNLEGRVIHVVESAVPHYEASGWTRSTITEPRADEDDNEAGATPADTEQDAPE